MTAFTVVRRRSTAAEFHALDFPSLMSAQVWIHDITTPALVLGSTQRDEVVDRVACAADGVQVVRRRSGGGAVLLLPGEVTWFDVLLPATGPWWSDDVHTPMVWLGERLGEALADEGVEHVEVHRGGLVTTPWSRLICFDGLGAGEVSIAGRKLVGISQRRTRDGARLQVCWYHRCQPEDLAHLLTPPIDIPALRSVATLAVDVSRRVVDGLADRLASSR